MSAETQAFLSNRRARLVRFNGCWFTREPGGFYREIGDELIRSEIRGACAWPLTVTNVNATIDEIKSATVIDSHGIELPAWLVPGVPLRARDLIVCRNGILDPQSGQIFQHTDDLFTLNALPYDFDSTAPLPGRWLLFLDEVFSGDGESIRELQKMFGYFLTLDTGLQKIFAIIGPKRSGKGTIGRILGALIGQVNCCGPSFHKIGGDFGLQSFIGKQLAIIADARLGHRTDKIVVAERLLSISGEDALDISRKNLTDWHGRLSTRLLILSNELPALPDPSGSLASRFVAFSTPVSFYGREDIGLTETLLLELPGILNWSLAGLGQLRADGRIVTPAAARDLIVGIEALGSPVKAFVADCCTLNRDASAPKDVLWSTYCLWHRSNGLPGVPLSKEMFGRSLKTAFPGEIKDYRPRYDDGARAMCWLGIAICHPSSFPPSINYGRPFGQG